MFHSKKRKSEQPERHYLQIAKCKLAKTKKILDQRQEMPRSSEAALLAVRPLAMSGATVDAPAAGPALAMAAPSVAGTGTVVVVVLFVFGGSLAVLARMGAPAPGTAQKSGGPASPPPGGGNGGGKGGSSGLGLAFLGSETPLFHGIVLCENEKSLNYSAHRSNI